MTTRTLIKWYHANKRELPWRTTKDPYKVWLSEIILQQTRVAQGLPYYLKFSATFPTVFDLAKAPEQKVMKLWQGLGYYSRARNLHAAARQVVKEYKGVFPSEYEELKKLKGVGDYTAAAIASFCFNRPHAVVDGNVFRVLSRLYAIQTPINSTAGKKQFTQLANELINKKDPGTFNQAIMEFGAVQCTPVNPNCSDCVLQNSCLVGGSARVKEFPVKIGKAKISERYFEYFFITAQKKTYIQKRGAGDIWQNLYQLPVLEVDKLKNRAEVLKNLRMEIFRKDLLSLEIKSVSAIKKHLLSHQKIMARFWHINLPKPIRLKGFNEVNINKLIEYPFPVLIGNHLKEITIFE